MQLCSPRYESLTCVFYPILDTKYHVSDPPTEYPTVTTLKIYSHYSYKWLFPIPILSKCLNSPTALQQASISLSRCYLSLQSDVPSAQDSPLFLGLVLLLWWSMQNWASAGPLCSVSVWELLNWVPHYSVSGAELTLTFLVPSGWARLHKHCLSKQDHYKQDHYMLH